MEACGSQRLLVFCEGDKMSNVIHLPIKKGQISRSFDNDAHKLAFSKAETQVASWHLLIAALRRLEAQLHQHELVLHASGNSLEVYLAIRALSGARQKLQNLIAEGELQADILDFYLVKFGNARR